MKRMMRVVQCQQNAPREWNWLSLFIVFCILSPPSHAAQVLRKKNEAMIRVEMVVLRAGPGSAYIARGRLYKGDTVTILETNNLTDWVRIRSGQLAGYLPIKTLHFGAKTRKKRPSPNDTRRKKDYFYNRDGQRINLDGHRVGSGETHLDRESTSRRKQAVSPKPLQLNVGVGTGRLSRSFRTNAPRQSVLSSAVAKPLVLCFFGEAKYDFSQHFRAQASLLDYRLGQTELQTRVLNDGSPFTISNEGQNLNLGLLGTIRSPTVDLTVGPAVSYQRDSFQETQPLTIFLSTQTTILSAQVALDVKINALTIHLSGVYGTALSSSLVMHHQPFHQGQHWSVRAGMRIPLNDALFMSVEGRIRNTTMSFMGSSNHTDSLTDPNREFSYTVSEVVDRFAALLVSVGVNL